MLPPNTQTTTSQTLARLALGLIMLSAGISHLTFLREAFHAQVPDWVPFSKDLVVILSGVVEIALGAAMLALPRLKVWTGIILALFFVAIFPGNLSQYLNGIDSFGLDTDQKRLARLFFQPVLVFWALWSTGAWKELWTKKR
ncbi:DoxX family protein [Puniceicoccus vermicola]|uniref:DoxX family membrane protein n=1 Tax=Puniceicoccus vermicola TaxID=388746 RepID=A0A7X1AUN6_9BACT|nr:hypothetical protein [Puniceicoccus vermicola]MBC2600316.1 hypothetical protein [Puniceicoccus vermicola]